MATETMPLVSVIIPMFNAAKFVGQTLESLCRQTLTNFEIIVVDDGSTDNSIEIAENFAPQLFQAGIKLHLLELPKNTGMPGAVRNVGIPFARGKYIAFLDADDLLTPRALEELATLAEEYQADVVHTDTFFMLFDDRQNFSQDDLTVCDNHTLPTVDAPTFETPDLVKRVRHWVNRGYNWQSVTMFCRRDFILANQIYFPKLFNNEDMIFSFCVLCLAERFLRVPNVTYIYRQRVDSVSHEEFDDLAAHFHKWLRVLNDGMNALENFMTSVEFFAARPDCHYATLDFYFKEVSCQFLKPYAKNPPFALNPLVKDEFQSDDATLAAYLFNTVNIQRLQIMQLRHELAKFHQQ